MKKTFILMAALAVSSTAFAAGDVNVTRKGLGLGTPSTKFSNVGVENAVPVNTSPEVLFVPKYLPHYPTAAVIWPRIVEVPCKETVGVLQCEGFHWTPDMGRGEYLFITPKVVAEQKPVEKIVPVVVERVVEKKVLVEVPVKKKPE